MRVLVTGGAGFIGSHIVDELVALGHDVVVLDNLDPAAHRGTPNYLNPAARYHWADAADIDQWDAVLDGVDAVTHQAAKVGLGLDFGDVSDYVRNNVTATAAGLLALHRRGFEGRLVVASSMVVYGEGRYRCENHGVIRPGPRLRIDLDAGRFEPPCPECGQPLEAGSIPEDSALDPRNVYAATKVHTEHLAAAYGREHDGSAITMLRYHNVYGARMPRDTPYAGVASIFRSSVAAGRAPAVFEDGGQLRDFVEVRDVARANVLALTAAEPSAGAFNICSGQPRSILDMAAALVDADGHCPAPTVTGQYRLGDVRHVFASAERASKLLAFDASIAFEDGVANFAGAELREPPDGPR